MMQICQYLPAIFDNGMVRPSINICHCTYAAPFFATGFVPSRAFFNLMPKQGLLLFSKEKPDANQGFSQKR
jgi:hypothetical protein